MFLSENFENPGLPSGWTVVDNAAGSANPSFSNTTGHDGSGGNSGQGGHIGDNIDAGPNNTPGGWLQVPTTVLDSNAFSLSVDVRIDNEATIDDAQILIGDLVDGPYIYIFFAADGHSLNNDVYSVTNRSTGEKTTILDNYGSAYTNDKWYEVVVTWTPTGENVGTLSFAAYDPTDDTLFSNFNINDVQMPDIIQFGFGTANDRTSFDNVIINGAPIPSGPFYVEDFGAVGNGTTDDGPAIRAAIAAACVAPSGRTVIFDGAKTYRLGDYPGHLFAIELEWVQDLTLEGNGCQLLLHPQMCMMGFWRSENITVSGFEMDYDPIPFSQGTIISKDFVSETFQIDIDPNLPLPITQSEFEANWGGDWGLGASWEVSRDIEDTYIHPVSVEEIGPPGRYEITPRQIDIDRGQLENFDVGDIFVFYNYQGRNYPDQVARINATATAPDGERKFRERGSMFSIQKCKDVTLNEIFVYSTKYGAIACDSSSNLVFEGVRIRTPDSVRKMTALTTVVGITNCDIKANNMLIERAADDLFVRGDHYSVVSNVYSNKEFEVFFIGGLPYLPSDLEIGMTVVCFEVNTAEPSVVEVLDEAVITDCQYIDRRTRRITLDHDVPGMSAGSHAVGAKYEAEVTNSTFAMGANKGVYAKNDILISGCTFTKNNYDISFRDYATALQYSYDVEISDNTFVDTDIRSIILKGHSGVSTNYQCLRNYHWQDYEETSSLVSITNWDGGRIEDNTFDFSASASHISPSIVITNCYNYTDVNNVTKYHMIQPEEFEGTSLPSNWQVVDNAAGSANPTFSLSTGHDGTGSNAGQGGHIGDNIDAGPNSTIGGWLQSPVSVSAIYPFWVSFDIRIDHEGNIDDAGFVLGDLDSATGSYYYIMFAADNQEQDNDLYLVNDRSTGLKTLIIDQYNGPGSENAFLDGKWYKVIVEWDGDSTLTMNAHDPVNDSVFAVFTATDMVLPETVQFGFGTANNRATFDNIYIEQAFYNRGDLTMDSKVDMQDLGKLGSSWQEDYDWDILLGIADNWLR